MGRVDRHSGLKGYFVWRNGALVAQVSGTTATDTTVNASTAYSYTVSAVDNANNQSALSAAAPATTPSCQPPPDTIAPAAPATVTVTAASCTQVNISWSASTDASGISNYNVFRNGTLLKSVTGATTATTDSVAAASTNSYTVSAVDGAPVPNQSAQSSPAQSVTTPACPDATAPSVPASLTATAASCSQINLTWSASTDTGGSNLKGYNVYRGGVFLKFVAATSTTDTALAASTTFSYAVSAVDNANNESARSTTASATTPACADTTAPSIPANVAASVSSCSQVNVTWSASTDTGGSGLRGYQVYRNGAAIGTVQSATSFADSGLSGATAYSYVVLAIDNAGNSSMLSTAASVTTPVCADTAPPTVPASVLLTAASCTQIDVSWQASTDTGSSGMRGYQVYRNNIAIGAIVPITSFSDTGLTGATSYTYFVKAVDNAGNYSAASTAKATSTPACPLPPAAALAGFVQGIGKAGDVAVDAVNHKAYVASSDFGAAVIDVANPASPQLLRLPATPFFADRIAFTASFVVAGGRGAGLTLWNLTTNQQTTLAMTAAGVAASGNYAYVVQIIPGNPARDDLVVIDLTSKATVGRVTLPSGTGDIALLGNVVYAVGGASGVYAVDVSNPAAPAIVATTDTPGNATALAMDASTNRLYVGDTTDVAVLNIATPTAPTLLGSVTQNVNRIGASGTRVFTMLNGNLTTIDATNAAAPVVRTTQAAYFGGVVTGMGSYALIGSTDGGVGGLYIVDATNLASPTLVGSLHGSYDDFGLGVSGTVGVVAGNGFGLHVVEFTTPTTPVMRAAITGQYSGVTIAGTYAYALKLTPGNPPRIDLVVFDVHAPASPVQAGSVPLAGGNSVLVSGGYAYVTTGVGGIQIVDVRTPSAPAVVSTFDPSPGAGSATRLAIDATRHLLYVTDTTALHIVDVTNPGAPVLRSSLTVAADAVAVAGNRVFVIGGALVNDLQVVDATNASAPAVVGTANAHTGTGVAVLGNFVYVSTPTDHVAGTGGVLLYDITTNTPTFRNQVVVPGYTHNVISVGSYVYAGDNASVIDVIAPTS